MKITTFQNIIALLRNIPSGITAYRRYVQFKSDMELLLADWTRIGGFNASTGELLNFMTKFSVNLVEYATWTPITADDLIATFIRDILIDHRDIVIHLIDWVRYGHEPTLQELTTMAEEIHASSDKEYGSPMTALYIIGILYHALVWLRTGRELLPTPDTTPNVVRPLVRRPIRNLVQKLFNKS